MEEDRVTFFGKVYRGWKAKALTGVPIAAGAYQWTCDQLGAPTVATVFGMTPMPWWGWLLLAQLGALYGLFEYVRLNAPLLGTSSGNVDRVAPRMTKEAERKQIPHGDLRVRDLGLRIGKIMMETNPDASVRDVNLEIADKATHKNLTVWGRYGEKAIEVFSKDEVRFATFDFEQNAARTSNGWNGFTYSDVMLVSAEVDRIWPPIEESDEQTTVL